jgi:hypothetical protein
VDAVQLESTREKAAMLYGSPVATQLESPRGQAVRLGLRLANSHLGVVVLGLYYAFWVVIGLALCLVLIPFAVSGKMDAFNQAMNPVAWYGFLLPKVFLAAITWAIMVFSRILWCAIPESLTPTLLAFGSVAAGYPSWLERDTNGPVATTVRPQRR